MLNKFALRSELRLPIAGFAALLVLIAAIFIRSTPIQASLSGLLPARANPGAVNSGSSSAAPIHANVPQAAPFDCVPSQVGVDLNQFVIVICANALAGTINDFAVPVADSKSSLILSTMTTAFVMGKHLNIYYYDETTSGPPFGCLVTNCRKIGAVYILP